MFATMIDEWVPEALDTIPPGYVLAAILDDIDLDSCTGHDRVRVLQAHQRMASHYTALTYSAMNSVVDALDANDIETDFVEEAAAAEIAAALRLTRRAADIEMTLALELKHRLPQVWEALCDGRIDIRRARVIVNGTLHLSIANARGVIDQIIGDAGQLTTGQLGHKLRKLCIDIDPEDSKQRYEHAVDDRRIVVEANDTGTADLICADMPPDRLAAAINRVNRIARNLRGGGETRTMDQLRSDVVLDLLVGSGAATHSGKGTLDIHTDLKSLAELANSPADLAGYGPVVADIARQVAERQIDGEWRWTIDDPDTGRPIAGGITRRRPTAMQRRHVQQRDRTCIHPGCRMPAVNCDIDHRDPWSECHTTHPDNLSPLCRHHHMIRHHAGWTYRPLANGDYQFTTPLGHVYTTSGQSP